MEESYFASLLSKRRDTRHFRPDVPVPSAVLNRAFQAAESAPSVGLTQPLRIVLVRSKERRKEFFQAFEAAQEEHMQALLSRNDPRHELYRKLKLQGILEAPVGLAVFCEPPQETEFSIGTLSLPRTVEWSAACAIQNLWLSLTDQGFGMGWVSILKAKHLQQLVQAPPRWQPMGYLCVGQPADDYEGRPMLEGRGWQKRKLLQVYEDTVKHTYLHLHHN